MTLTVHLTYKVTYDYGREIADNLNISFAEAIR